MPQTTLTIKRKWFDMIATGRKKEEYREIKPFYDSRFEDFFPLFYKGKKPKLNVSVIFRNGYAKSSPELTVRLTGIRKGKGKPEWGAEKGKEYYVLELGEILYCSEEYDTKKQPN